MNFPVFVYDFLKVYMFFYSADVHILLSLAFWYTEWCSFVSLTYLEVDCLPQVIDP